MKKIRIWHVLNLVGLVFVSPACYMLMNWLITGRCYGIPESFRGLVGLLIGVILWNVSDGVKGKSDA